MDRRLVTLRFIDTPHFEDPANPPFFRLERRRTSGRFTG